MRVLVVQDDLELARDLSNLLHVNGHRPVLCRRGGNAPSMVMDIPLVLLDLELADIDAHVLLRTMRARTSAALLVMSDRGDEPSVVRGLRSGADDYVVKPVRPRELVARIEALSRRADSRGMIKRMIQVQDIIIDLDARVVRMNRKTVGVTVKEFDLLAILAQNRGVAVSRRQIIGELWGDHLPGASRTLDVHMTALRGKLGHPECLRTVRGFGYRMG